MELHSPALSSAPGCQGAVGCVGVSYQEDKRIRLTLIDINFSQDFIFFRCNYEASSQLNTAALYCTSVLCSDSYTW